MKFRSSPPVFGGLALCVFVATGCNSAELTATSSAAPLTGNWSFTAPAAQGAQPITLNAGFVQTGEAVTAVAHLSGASCISASTGIALSGAVSALNQVSLISQPFAGTTLSLKGQLSANGKALSNATWTFSGGNCAALGSESITATDYAEINGTYTGTFIDAGNNQLAITATLTQTTQPDPNGQYHLSGSATFPNNPCFTQPIVTDSLVTGSSLSTTYSQGSASITAVGTFNSDATQLTVTNWQVSGGLCDGDTGTGSLTEQ